MYLKTIVIASRFCQDGSTSERGHLVANIQTGFLGKVRLLVGSSAAVQRHLGHVGILVAADDEQGQTLGVVLCRLTKQECRRIDECSLWLAAFLQAHTGNAVDTRYCKQSCNS